MIVVQFIYEDGRVCDGVFTHVSGDCAVVHVHDHAFMPLYFFLSTGKHYTWGQGRSDHDEWPRLTKESFDKINNTVIW